MERPRAPSRASPEASNAALPGSGTPQMGALPGEGKAGAKSTEFSPLARSAYRRAREVPLGASGAGEPSPAKNSMTPKLP